MLSSFARTPLIFSLAILTVAACGKNSETDQASSDVPAGPVTTEERLSAPADVENGRKQFLVCAVCHDVVEGTGHRVGPNLWGIYESEAAMHDDFAYSQGLRDSGLVWDDETLDAYLERPIAVVPRGRMAYPGEPDAANRRDIIAYLKTLK